MVATCTSTRDRSTLPAPSTSKMGSLLYCGMAAGHRLTSVFDLTTCRKQYLHDFEASGSQLSLPIVELRSFAVIQKKYHLKAKYLVSTRARRRTYRCHKLPVSSFSSIFFVQGKEHASGLQGSAWLPVAGRHQATDG